MRHCQYAQWQLPRATCEQIFDAVSEVVTEYRPDVVAIESVFMHKNAGSALKLGHARSAALCATFEFDVDVFEYAPREIKQAIVGTGAASKEQVQHMVVALLGLDAAYLPRMRPTRSRRLCVMGISIASGWPST